MSKKKIYIYKNVIDEKIYFINLYIKCNIYLKVNSKQQLRTHKIATAATTTHHSTIYQHIFFIFHKEKLIFIVYITHTRTHTDTHYYLYVENYIYM